MARERGTALEGERKEEVDKAEFELN